MPNATAARPVTSVPIATGLLFAALVGPVGSAAAQDWPRFRGTGGAGHVDAVLPDVWTAADLRFKIPVPGTGHSSPVIVGKRVFLTTGDETKGGTRTTLCYRTTDGSLLWSHEFDRSAYKALATNSLATSTPVADDKRLFVCWVDDKQYSVLALDHDGRQLWRADLGAYVSDQGFGASPVHAAGVVIAPHEHEGDSTVVGLDAATGEKKWTLPRKGRSSEYATPCVRNLPGGGAEVLLASRATGVTAVDPATGKVTWESDVFGAGGRGGAIPSPQLIKGADGADLLLVSASRNLALLRLPDGKQAADPKILWRVTRGAPDIPTPVVHDGRIFVWTEKGIISALSLADGQVVKQVRSDAIWYGSPVCVGGRLFNYNEDGEVLVLTADAELKELARHRVGYRGQATPAFGDGALFVRTDTHLLAVQSRPAGK